MLLDPCGSVVTAGLYGDVQGMATRFDKSDTLDLFVGEASEGPFGYYLWFPDYDSSGTASGPMSMFSYATNAATIAPTNDLITGPMGASNTGGYSQTAPGHPFTTGAVVQDSRCLSACLKMEYTGLLSNCHGQYCTLQVSPEDIMATGNGTPIMTVSRAFELSNNIQRITPQGMELKWQPAEGSHNFRAGDLNDDALFTAGNVGVPAALLPTPGANPVGLLIAWRGITSTLPFSILATKSLEFRIAPDSGLQKNVTRIIPGAPTVQEIVREAQAVGGESWFAGVAEYMPSYSQASSILSNGARLYSSYKRRQPRNGLLLHDGLR